MIGIFVIIEHKKINSLPNSTPYWVQIPDKVRCETLKFKSILLVDSGVGVEGVGESPGI